MVDAGADRPAKDEAREELARVLFRKMEHLDPRVVDDPNELFEWDHLTDRQREFYRLCLEEVLREVALVRAALD